MESSRDVTLRRGLSRPKLVSVGVGRVTWEQEGTVLRKAQIAADDRSVRTWLHCIARMSADRTEMSGYYCLIPLLGVFCWFGRMMSSKERN